MVNMEIVPACKNIAAQYVEMRVPLYSYGWEEKVNKAPSHLRGTHLVNVDFYQQKVTMWGICNKYEVLATMRKKRKQTQFWNPEDNNVEMEPSQPTLSSLYPLPHDCSMPSLTLARARSLNWKAWKKVFIRSNSF
ncbi:uncharacterized protein LOC114263520 [Camellia sinensis]|uniref:uncharacterized protein LOC114263520 n=1 Tax=Camellia sinensis TaxID=4442 RepID=UPI001035AD08|nr:uncharacterized protein LOC114263520 [Camellia sinensis]